MKINLFRVYKNIIGSKENIHATELFTLKWLIVFYVYFTLIKKERL